MTNGLRYDAVVKKCVSTDHFKLAFIDQNPSTYPSQQLTPEVPNPQYSPKQPETGVTTRYGRLVRSPQYYKASTTGGGRV